MTMPDTKQSIDVDVLGDVLLGLCGRGWSGMVAIDTGAGDKKLFFRQGHLVFAASNIIDDRLGELLYRHDLISLDDWMTSAVKVDRDAKFGQVLVNTHLLNHVELWEALKLQVEEITRSVFFVNKVRYEMIEGDNLAPTEIAFLGHSMTDQSQSGSFPVIERARSYGVMFREFVSGVASECGVELIESEERLAEYPEETFLGGFLRLIDESKEVSKLISVSKLTPLNTMAILMRVLNKGLCRIDPDAQLSEVEPVPTLAECVQRYDHLLTTVKDMLSSRDLVLPHLEMIRFADRLNGSAEGPLFLGPDCRISGNSLRFIYSQCARNRGYIDYFETRISSLRNFLLHVALDMLPGDMSRILSRELASVA